MSSESRILERSISVSDRLFLRRVRQLGELFNLNPLVIWTCLQALTVGCLILYFGQYQKGVLYNTLPSMTPIKLSKIELSKAFVQSLDDWEISVYTGTKDRESSKRPMDVLYGPSPRPPHSAGQVVEVYSFLKVHKSFNNTLAMERMTELSKKELEQHLINTFPVYQRSRVKRFLSASIKMAEKYQIDPLWVLSVMSVESSFNPVAKSHVKAYGLMQIMPATGTYLARRMKNIKNPELANQMRKIPIVNLEMGVYYLKYLLGMFHNNYAHATIAYNMGPYWLLRRLRKGNYRGNSHLYLAKVREAYQHVSKSLLDWQKRNVILYRSTLVVLSRFRSKDFLPRYESPVEFAKKHIEMMSHRKMPAIPYKLSSKRSTPILISMIHR